LHLVIPCQSNFADQKVYEIANLTGEENYVLLDAEGEGHYVGCNLSIDHLNHMPGFSWPGEGDDMFFIDGEQWHWMGVICHIAYKMED
jgi:Protein of unknown function (DUF2961)